jgi:hypothetical protein
MSLPDQKIEFFEGVYEHKDLEVILGPRMSFLNHLETIISKSGSFHVRFH